MVFPLLLIHSYSLSPQTPPYLIQGFHLIFMQEQETQNQDIKQSTNAAGEVVNVTPEDVRMARKQRVMTLVGLLSVE